ncbi:hypothetical protein A2U01_0079866, partial [Trifolium medium]|nr:hypothetical protein [Trifolium medium]
MEDILFTRAKTLQERNINDERFDVDNYMAVKSVDNNGYYHSESYNDLD